VESGATVDAVDDVGTLVVSGREVASQITSPVIAATATAGDVDGDRVVPAVAMGGADLDGGPGPVDETDRVVEHVDGLGEGQYHRVW